MVGNVARGWKYNKISDETMWRWYWTGVIKFIIIAIIAALLGIQYHPAVTWIVCIAAYLFPVVMIDKSLKDSVRSASQWRKLMWGTAWGVYSIGIVVLSIIAFTFMVFMIPSFRLTPSGHWEIKTSDMLHSECEYYESTLLFFIKRIEPDTAAREYGNEDNELFGYTQNE